MGKSYLFECPKCDYRASVSGGPDRGFNAATQTIVCLDCKKLYDVVIRMRTTKALGTRPSGPADGLRPSPLGILCEPTTDTAPKFEVAVNRLQFVGAAGTGWANFKTRCPVTARHRIKLWSAPGKCPRCSTYLERTVTPWRIWD